MHDWIIAKVHGIVTCEVNAIVSEVTKMSCALLQAEAVLIYIVSLYCQILVHG